MIHYAFPHTSHLTGRGAGTGFVVSNDWKFTQLLPAHSYDLFEYHAIMITDPFKLYLVVIYHPQGQLGSFVYELDILLPARFRILLGSPLADAEHQLLFLGPTQNIKHANR